MTNKKIIGMIHLAGGLGVVERALREIEIYENNGLYGAIIENYHGDVDDITKVLENIDTTIEVGINILPNEYDAAFMLAKEYGASFIQLDYVGGIYKSGHGIKYIEDESYKESWSKSPDTMVMGGVWPKYYQPLNGSSLEDDIKRGMSRSNYIVVTGEGTGKETPLDKIKQFRNILGDFPLIIGAGVDSTNAAEQLKYADGAIVGSAFKPGKATTAEVKNELVEEFMNSLEVFAD